MTAPIWLTAADVALVADRLRALGWLAHNEALTEAATAGDGNLNLVLRVSAGSRSAILKQARPWVEKYPAIAAPVARSAVEASFYRLVHAAPRAWGVHAAAIGGRSGLASAAAGGCWAADG